MAEMTREDDLAERYRSYLACLNARAWTDLGPFVSTGVIYNGRQVGLSGYSRKLREDTIAIPDLRFDLELLVVQPPHVAARLRFDCTPRGRLFGVAVDGRRVRFSENVFYRYAGGRIAEVWSVIDEAAVRHQVAGSAQD